MGRPPETPGRPLTTRIGVRVSEGMLRYVDKERGRASRGAFIRQLVRDHARKAGQ